MGFKEKLYSAGKAKQLSAREQKILAVIQHSVIGRQYARELDHAGVKPRKSWTDDGCPSTYLGAYDSPEADHHWRQMLQNEKTNVRRKAEQLGLLAR